MKKKYAAFLREKNSLRELAITDAGKPAVDPSLPQQWQNKVNLLAMEANKTIALILRVKQASVSILLKSDHLDQANIERYLASGLYCITDLGNQGLLITSSASSESQDGSPASMASITTCFGLPIQWPDAALFGVICVLNYPGKTLKPVYRNILSELRDTVEQELAELLKQHQLPQPSPAEVSAPINSQPIKQEAAASREQDLQPQPPKTVAPAPADDHAVEQAPVGVPTQSPLPQNSETDALTAIYNRKKIEEILKHEFERAKRYFKTFSVTVIDLNSLQMINDTFGQDIGDEVLQVFAKSVGSKIRETDSWGRWGGDAFILVCPYADTVETQQMFTRIKPLVSRDMKATKAFLDFPFGVSQYEPDDLTYKAIVIRAEENMHQYKEMIKRKSFVAADDRNASSR